MAVQTQIQVRRGTAASWTSTNPTLAAGEMGLETDTGLFKIGNGVTRWNALAYGGVIGPTGPTGNTGPTGVTGPVPTNVSSITINGTLTVQETQEVVNAKTGASGVVVHDWLTGSIYFHTSIASNFTCNITNLPTVANRSYVVVLILTQGATAYYASALQINGVSQSMLWPNAFITPPTANRTEVQSFTLYYNGSNWIAMAQLTSFG